MSTKINVPLDQQLSKKPKKEKYVEIEYFKFSKRSLFFGILLLIPIISNFILLVILIRDISEKKDEDSILWHKSTKIITYRELKEL